MDSIINAINEGNRFNIGYILGKTRLYKKCYVANWFKSKTLFAHPELIKERFVNAMVIICHCFKYSIVNV